MGKINKNRIVELSDAEFLSFLYSERDREESLNSYQGWNLWAAVGAMITVVCTAYSIICSHMDEIDKLRTIYLASWTLGTIFCYWYSVVFYCSSMGRKRAKDYKRIKHLKDVAPRPYLFVTSVCSVVFALIFLFVECDSRWNIVTISWTVLAVLHLLICLSLYVNRNTIVWAVKEDVWFAKTWIMVVVGLLVYVLFWMIWKCSIGNIDGPFIGTPEFELAVCITAFVMLAYLLLKIVFKNRKSSEIDVLIDEYLYKGKSKEDVFYQLRINLLGRDILETCSKELLALKKYYDAFDSQKKDLEDLRTAFARGSIDAISLQSKFDALRKSLDYSEEWSKRVGALHNRLAEVAKNVPELKEEDKFRNMLNIVVFLMRKTEVINDEIKMASDEMERFIDEHVCFNCGCCKRRLTSGPKDVER